jgi:hypothetical protein
MKHLIVILLACAAIALAGPMRVTPMRVTIPPNARPVQTPMVSGKAARREATRREATRREGQSPGVRETGTPPVFGAKTGSVPISPIEAGLERLSPAERANAAIQLDLGSSASPVADREAKAIEVLWNSGDCDAAIARLRGLPNYTDPTKVFVGINWRTPIPGPPGADWGHNIQIGGRDSIVHIIFDRHNTTGALFVALISDSAAQTWIYVNRSADNGLTWGEAFAGYWITPDALLACAGGCSGNHFYLYHTQRGLPDLIRVFRFLGTTGAWVAFRSGCFSDTAYQSALPDDSIREVAFTSSDDRSPGWRIYAFGATKSRKLALAYSDSFAQPWNQAATNVDWCDGGLSACCNDLWSSNVIFAGWRYQENPGVVYPSVGSWDTSGAFVAYSLNVPSPSMPNTSIAAYHDTVVMAYEHSTGSYFYTRELVSYDNAANWFWWMIPDDSAALRENVNITGRHGGGFSAVYRERGGPDGRDVMYTHSPSADAYSWSTPDTVSDWRPHDYEPPRVQWLGPDLYGVVYLKGSDAPGYTVWFNRSDFPAIAERPESRPALFDLRAVPGCGSVRFRFNNPARGKVNLSIFDASGRLVRREQPELSAGRQELTYAGATSGIYFAALGIARATAQTKFFFVK